MENSGQIQADPTLPPDLSHPYFLNNNDGVDFDNNDGGENYGVWIRSKQMRLSLRNSRFLVTYLHLKVNSSFAMAMMIKQPWRRRIEASVQLRQLRLGSTEDDCEDKV